MRKSLFFLLLVSLLPLSQSWAKAYKVSEVPMVHLADRTRYVSNPDNILFPSSVATMDSLLASLEEKTGIQVLVAVLTGIEGGDCFDFALRLGEENGVGQKGRDNGLVILLSTEERCVQFVTGYGLEGVMPDAICKRIQQRHMLEHFAIDDWNTGMVNGIRAVCDRLDGSMDNVEDEEKEELIALMIFGAVLVLGIAFVFLIVWCMDRCPKCGKHDIMRVSSQIVQRCNGYVVRDDTYRCLRCGHTFIRKVRADDPNDRGGGIFVGGGLGRGFGGGVGGGFRGGSFGGGHFGGGGAGSRF